MLVESCLPCLYAMSLLSTYTPVFQNHSPAPPPSPHRRHPDPKPFPPLGRAHPKASKRFRLATALLNSSCSLSMKTRHSRKSSLPKSKISRRRRIESSSASPSTETKPALCSAIVLKQSCVKGGGLWARVDGTACSRGRVRCVGEEWVRIRGGCRARLLGSSSMLKAANACSTASAAVPVALLTGAPVVTETSDCPSSGGMVRGDGRG